MTTRKYGKTKLADLKQMVKIASGEDKLLIKAEIAKKELIQFRKEQRAQAKALAAAEKAQKEANEIAAMQVMYPQYETISFAVMKFGIDVKEHQNTVGCHIAVEIIKLAKTYKEVDAIMNTLRITNYGYLYEKHGLHLS